MFSTVSRSLCLALAVLSMTAFSATASPVLTEVLDTRAVSEVPVELQPRTECARYVLIATRGTSEPQAATPQLAAMSNYTLNNVTGGIAYQTVYPASSEVRTEQIGADDIVRRIEEGLANCPSQKYVLLGYSQGVAATTIALLNYTDTSSAGYKAIAGVLLVGNPAKLSYKISNVDQLGGSSTNSTNGVYYTSRQQVPPVWYGEKLIDICYQDDLVCNGLSLWTILNAFINHLRYSDASVQNLGAAFLIKRLKAALA